MFPFLLLNLWSYYYPKRFGRPNTAFHCCRVSQRWAFESGRAKPQTPQSSRSARRWTQVISDRLTSLRQQKPVGLRWVRSFSDIQEPQTIGVNQDTRSVVIWAPRPRTWSHLGFQVPDNLFPQIECLPLTWPPADTYFPEVRLAQLQASC